MTNSQLYKMGHKYCKKKNFLISYDTTELRDWVIMYFCPTGVINIRVNSCSIISIKKYSVRIRKA